MTEDDLAHEPIEFQVARFGFLMLGGDESCAPAVRNLRMLVEALPNGLVERVDKQIRSIPDAEILEWLEAEDFSVEGVALQVAARSNVRHAVMSAYTDWGNPKSTGGILVVTALAHVFAQEFIERRTARA